IGDHRPGGQRGGGADGRPVPAPRRRYRPGDRARARPRVSGNRVSDAPLVIRGGTVVDATGSRRADVAVQSGRVAAVEPSVEAGPRGEGGRAAGGGGGP